MGILDPLGKGLDSVRNAVSEQAAITRFLTEAAQKTVGMTGSAERGRVLQIYEELLRKYDADKNPQSKLGRFYAKVEPKARQSRQPLAHSRCTPGCVCSRALCNTCLPLRLDALNAIALIDDPAAYRRQFQVAGGADATRPAGCGVCGAPLEPGAAACPYCGAPAAVQPERTTVGSVGEIPSVVEHALEAVFRYTEFTAKQADAKEILHLTLELTPLAGAALQTAASQMDQLEALRHQKMTEDQAVLVAQKKGLSMSAYLRALMDDDVPNYGIMLFQEDLERRRVAEQQRHEQAMAAQRQAYAAQRRNNEEFWERQRAIQRTTQYSGGSGVSSSDRHCCGTCEKYMPAIGECSLNRSHRSATEYCGSYSLR